MMILKLKQWACLWSYALLVFPYWDVLCNANKFNAQRGVSETDNININKQIILLLLISFKASASLDGRK